MADESPPNNPDAENGASAGDDEECAVCRDMLSEGQTVRLECGHVFHTQCAVTWFRMPQSGGACPMCRGEPTHQMDYYTARERYIMVRRMSRNKSAPKRLKTLVARLKKRELELKALKKERAEYGKRSEVKEVKKTMNKLRRKVWDKCRVVRNAKRRIALFTCPSDDNFRIPAFRCGGNSMFSRYY